MEVDLVVCVVVFLVSVCVFLCVYLRISLCVCLSMWLLSPAGRWQGNLHEGKGERRDNIDLENSIKYPETDFYRTQVRSLATLVSDSLTDSVTFSRLD